jgi:hypothetical protein
MGKKDFLQMPLLDQIQYLYRNGTFITDIRYYNYKVNLYLLDGNYFEVFVNHKNLTITTICPLDFTSNRLNFYLDQIKLPIAG